MAIMMERCLGLVWVSLGIEPFVRTAVLARMRHGVVEQSSCSSSQARRVGGKLEDVGINVEDGSDRKKEG